jgi:hypothetical protein
MAAHEIGVFMLFVVIFMFMVVMALVMRFEPQINEWKRRRAARIEDDIGRTPVPDAASIESLLGEIYLGDDAAPSTRRVLPHGLSAWAARLNLSVEEWVAFLLALTGRDAFPDELLVESRVEWAMANRIRGRALALVLEEMTGVSGLDDLAREGLKHEESVEIAHTYIEQWEGVTLADYEREQVEDERQRGQRVGPSDDFDGALELSTSSGGGELTVTNEQGSLSQTDDT